MTTFGSLFSGIGGFDLGFERAGMSCKWQVEIDNAAAGVLDRHWSGVAKYKDVRNVGRDNLETVDIICGGFPCQDLSIAGKRAGLDGERSGLWFEFRRIVEELKPRWVVVENVPGLLSSNGGADFAVVIRGLVECGYGVCWRVLDSQYFGVAQRRRRVFVVGSLGNGRAAEVLFERESGIWDPPPSREKGAGIAGTLDAKSASSNRGSQTNEHEFLAYSIASNAIGRKPENGPQRGDYAVNVCHTLDTISQPHAVAYNIMPTNSTKDYKAIEAKYSQALTTDGNHGSNQGGTYIAQREDRQGVGVRRLTPVECERLQGFPDVEKCVIINVCTDHLKNSANVESRNPKLRKRVGNVGKGNWLEIARCAENNSSTSDQPISEPVAVNVQINLERQVLQIHSHGKLLLSVNIAESKNSSPLRMPIEDFAHLVALTITTQERITLNGKAGSHRNTMPSIHQPNGSSVVNLSGDVIGELVDGVEEFTKMANLCSTFTTLEVAQNSLNLKQALITLSYCVASVIASYIPEITNLTSSYNLKLSTVSGWTYGQSDSARYRQLGNAVTVNVAEWIGRRIVEA